MLWRQYSPPLGTTAGYSCRESSDAPPRGPPPLVSLRSDRRCLPIRQPAPIGLPFAEKISKLGNARELRMTRYKFVERDFPHIVETLVPERGLGSKRDAMNDFHARHGIKAHLRHGRYFAHRKMAEAFRASSRRKGCNARRQAVRFIYELYTRHGVRAPTEPCAAMVPNYIRQCR